MTYSERIKDLEKRICYKLPKDFIEIYEKYEGMLAVSGEWKYLEEISLAKDFDIINFLIITERPELLNIEDCNHIIPLLVDNDAYVVMDLREEGKGVFIIWSDEEELGFQSKNFKTFIDNLEEIKKNKSNLGEDFLDFNYLEEYND